MIANSLYLASKYSRRDELREVAKRLDTYGIKITSSWLAENYSLNVAMKDIDVNTHQELAKTDLDDIVRANGFLFFAEDQNAQPPRGSRHVEFGYALAQGLQMYVIGEPENIFHHLPNVHCYPTLDAFFEEEFTYEHPKVGGSESRLGETAALANIA